jgi:hypothetical protein
MSISKKSVCVILDCLTLLAELEKVSVSFVSRKRNLAAHTLVGVASSVGSKSWVGNVPYQINHIICNDFVLS